MILTKNVKCTTMTQNQYQHRILGWVGMHIYFTLIMKMLYCIMNSGSAENLVPNAKGMLFELSREENTGDAQIECYKDFAKSGYNIQVIRNIVICYHLEDISIVALIFSWKIKKKMSDSKPSNQNVQQDTA